MNTVEEIRQVLSKLSLSEQSAIAAWLRETGVGGYTVAEPAAAYEPAYQARWLSVEEYLEFEDRSLERHEYVAGEVFAMSGSSLRHNLISLNLSRAFHSHFHLQGGQCRVFNEVVKVRLKIGTKEFFYYPDVIVACGTLNLEERYLLSPKLIVEVLSPSTESIDRREKMLNYQQIDSLEEYVLVAQSKEEVSLYRRADQWKPQVLVGADAVAEFRSIDLSIPAKEIYEGARG